jgi:hypothetical protein
VSSPWQFPDALTGDPLALPADLANRLQISPSSINTGVATLLLQQASDAVRENVKLQIDYVVGETVTILGDGGETLLLPQRPVTAVASVTLAGQVLTPVVLGSAAPTMYDWRPDGRLYRVTYGGSVDSGELHSRWPRGVPVVVTYSHGWVNGPPTQLQSVALDMAAAAYSNPEVQDSGRVGWVEWVTKNVGMTLNAQQQQSLDYYRRPYG